ncbi:hypothetical protein S40285_07772 [Stachybotrys chlorohalonatus IBT 40285]|uniref:Alcohol dehydrogenase-like C-terminal domain-containing protein n=1 Tax=Stachybotrys chlorohalonatus (strain IBT 40285) TaxID=1283841 RepID=A0A084QIN5_STAC4|nr:hypothetical protein S40285_07772 [Stachybotrys chlorohalonata IBT 40285]
MAEIPEHATGLVLKAYKEPLVFEKFPLPRSAPTGTALVQTLVVGIRPHCREHFAGNGFLKFNLPFISGNSCVARVISAGPDAVALRPGQLVFVHGFGVARDDPVNTQTLLGLHRGNGLTAEGAERAGVLFDQWPGYWRDFCSVPLENCIALDEKRLVDELGYTFDDLMYIDRLLVAYGSVNAAKLMAGETVVVAPATGHFSGAVVEVAAQIGCRVIALTRSAKKLEPLSSRHANIVVVEVTGDRAADVAAIRSHLPSLKLGADAYIDVSPPQATGNSQHFDMGLEVLRPGARAVLTGALFTATIPYFSLLLRNITLVGKWMYTWEEAERVARMVEAGVFKLGKQAGHDSGSRGFKFEDWEEGLLEAEKAVEWGRHVVFKP